MLRSRFLGLGVAATGPTLAGDPTRRWAVDWLQGWRDLDLQRLFADYLGLPVWIENDGTLAALAEYYDSGLIRTCSSAIVFFIGHGVGGGIIVDRAILRGEHGNAGEIGRLFPGGSARPSGIDLLAELQAAGAAIHALNEVEIHQDTHAALIASWVERAGRQLAVAADSGVAWLDPGAIVVSGALPLPILRALGEALERAEWATAFPHLPRPTVYVSRLGSWAAAVGAALLPIHQLAAPNVAR
nr:ROK family protein [Sphingomonas sp. CFBP 13603]